MLFAILAILSFALQNICCKEYGKRYPGTLYTQSVMVVFSMALVTAIMAVLGGAQPLNAEGYLIAVAFGAIFVITIASMTMAMNSGHLGITLLVQNSALLIPSLFGLLVWNERLTLLKGAGIVLILMLLAMSVGDGDSAAGNVRNWNRKRWLALVSLAFLGDGALSILQALMGRACATTDSVTFTFWTSLFSLIICLAILAGYRLRGPLPRMLATKQERLPFAGLILGIGVGTAGGNCFSILALTQLPSVILFPLRQGGLVLLMWVVGIFLYREKLTRRGLLMLLTGLTGLTLLNL